jgi:hypothetical protein
MHEPHTREVRSSKSMLLFYAILGLGLGDSMYEPRLGLGDSMYEPHKGCEEFQIYVVVLCHFGLRVGRFNA